jgi:hypothetical protein
MRKKRIPKTGRSRLARANIKVKRKMINAISWYIAGILYTL